MESSPTTAAQDIGDEDFAERGRPFLRGGAVRPLTLAVLYFLSMVVLVGAYGLVPT